MDRELLLKIEGLDLSFKTSQGLVHALRGVDISLYRGQTVAIVGESGSGKSVTMKSVVGLLGKNAVIHSGRVLINMGEDAAETNDSVVAGDAGSDTVGFGSDAADTNGSDSKTAGMTDLLTKDIKWIRKNINGKKVAMVFQDPMTSLDPLMTIGNQLMEGIILHTGCDKKTAWERAVSLLTEVGLTEPEVRMRQFPHQLSGGQRQRVVIAIALSCDPEILICDEPTTALDVTMQAKILDLIRSLQINRKLAIIIITHNMGVVARVADYICVMYAGRIIERGSEIDIFYNPKHPYTWGLLSAMPTLDTKVRRLYAIPGTPPNLLYPIVGDAFAPRNEFAMDIDFKEEAPMFKVNTGHYAATWLLDERAPKVDMPAAVREKIEAMKAWAREEANGK